MATSPNGFTAQLERTERRRAAAQARRERQQRIALIGGAVVLLGIIAGLIVGRSSSAPAPTSPPQFKLTWPQANVVQNVSDGMSFVGRPDQKIILSVDSAAGWDIAWADGGAVAYGPSYSWSGQQNLVVKWSPAVSGIKKLFAWHRPTRQLSLHGVAAKISDGRAEASATGNYWVYRQIQAQGAVAWDEKVLPLLSQSVIPDSGGWMLRSGFDTATQLDPSATYAETPLPANAAEAMTNAARHIAEAAPEASLKFIVHEEMTPPTGIIRIAFDGKREHAAWIKKPGEAKGIPYRWWKPAAHN